MDDPKWVKGMEVAVSFGRIDIPTIERIASLRTRKDEVLSVVTESGIIFDSAGYERKANGARNYNGRRIRPLTEEMRASLHRRRQIERLCNRREHHFDGVPIEALDAIVAAIDAAKAASAGSQAPSPVIVEAAERAGLITKPATGSPS